ncbi:MAG: nucleotide sugar dehydrogenase [Deltaproteobacteria bacterium]|nr:nucleotide sugar dehydrogenase [Deltaproteobacteria bacterium]MBN2688519.1 nucleotide sugar dehydrogenase [Deltaproteobacteria bacterium]
MVDKKQSSRTFKKNILCIGGGYVGGSTMAVMAYKCPRYKVTVVDINRDRINQWNSETLPIYEPGIEEIVRATRGKNLFFSADIDKAIRDAEIIFVSVNTPTKNFGTGAGMAADLQYWEKTARQIRDASDSNKIIVDKGTLPVKTALAMERILTATKDVQFDVISNPEFLAEGTAVRDLLDPDRVLIGSRETPEGIRARNEIVEIYKNWVPEGRIITSDIWSSELSKLAANAFLAQRISSINAISAICEKTGANVTQIAHAIGLDKRIGEKYLSASVGFGGSCFQKDILNLVYLCRHYGLNEVADYWEGIVRINNYQKERFIFTMLLTMFNTLVDKKICLFGFAFKANTGDTRESPAIYIAKRLAEEKAELVISDPQAIENAKKDLADVDGKMRYVEDPYEAAAGCDAIAVMTEWNLYAKLDYEKIYRAMAKPAFIFDGRNILDHKRLFDIGFNVFPIGKPKLSHFRER